MNSVVDGVLFIVRVCVSLFENSMVCETESLRDANSREGEEDCSSVREGVGVSVGVLVTTASAKNKENDDAGDEK